MRYFLVAMLMIFSATHLQALVSIGVVGDSLSDEYLDSGVQANTDIAAFNWVEILAKLRSADLNFGEYRASLENPWPDHRAAGYQYNYAKAAATANAEARMELDFWLFSYAMKIDGPAVGSRYVADQVPMLVAEKVDYAVVAAGSNDFFYKTHTFSILGKHSANALVPDADFNQGIATSLLNHVDVLRAVGSKILLAYIPEGTAGGANASVVDAIRKTNRLLEVGALQRGIPMVRFFDFAKNADGGVSIADFTVVNGTTAKDADLLPKLAGTKTKCRADNLCAGPTHKNHFIADDGLHPNTLIQALMANQIINALNAAYALNIQALTNDEMLALVQ